VMKVRKGGVIQRGIDMFQLSKVNDVLNDLSEPEIISILRDGTARISDSMLQDFLFYLQNQHNVLSIFFAHELHPFTRFHRFLVLFCSLSLAFCLTAFGFLLQNTAWILEFPFSTIIAPLMLAIWDQVLELSAKCDCVQHSLCSDRIRHWMERFGKAILGVSVFCSAWFLAFGLVFVWLAKRISGGSFFRNFIQMTMTGWLYAIGLLLIQFLWASYREHRKHRNNDMEQQNSIIS